MSYQGNRPDTEREGSQAEDSIGINKSTGKNREEYEMTGGKITIKKVKSVKKEGEKAGTKESEEK